jgi:hypothetical protein
MENEFGFTSAEKVLYDEEHIDDRYDIGFQYD